MTVVIPDAWQEALPQNSQPLSSQLLALFNQPELNRIVHTTLESNLDLRQTALRLKEQRLLQHQTEAKTQPEANLKLTSERTKNGSINSSQVLSLDLSWELDVWGRLADQNASASATTQAVELDYQAAANSLAGRTIQSWIDIAIRTNIIREEQSWINSLEDTETIIAERYQNGITDSSAIADLETARASTARIRASLAAREQKQNDAYRHLYALQGRTSVVGKAAWKVPQIHNPPAQLPANVIANRPDIQAAYQRVLAANSDRSVAQKQLLPSFTLSANLSQSGNSISDRLSASSAWSLLGQLTAPLFNAGRLQAEADIAHLQAERSYLSYQQNLITAFNEVESSLSLEAALSEQERQLNTALKHSQASFTHYQNRYFSGLSDILDLLSAKQNVFDARIQLLEIKKARLTNRITLGLALGMGV